MDKGQTNSTARRQFRGTGLYWTLILTLVVAVAIIIGIIQNSQAVRLQYLAWTGSLSLAVALLAIIVLTVALTSLVGVIWRRRRRHQLTDSVELHELRGHSQAPLLAVRTEGLPPDVAVAAAPPGSLPAGFGSSPASSRDPATFV
jgi:uncharacterized integral membrane protein